MEEKVVQHDGRNDATLSALRDAHAKKTPFRKYNYNS